MHGIPSMNKEPIIQTTIPVSRINGQIVKMNRPDEGLVAVDAMLEAWPCKGGINVTCVAPYDAQSFGEIPLHVTAYGALTQEEFSHYFPSAV